MIANTRLNPLGSELRYCLQAARPPRLRSWRQFAEEEIIIPDGKYQGLRFSVDRQPLMGPLLDELERDHWLEVFVSGPSQSGKTLVAFCLPLLYWTIERRENYVVGLPDANMAADKWRIDLAPVFQASPRLRRLLPATGPGSQGGRITDTVTLANGSTIKWLTAGGDDTSKAGFTSRVVGITEAARFSTASETSVEADPLRQLRARLRSYKREERRLLVEGTLTIDHELPARARGPTGEPPRDISTRSRLVAPCPHCGRFVHPDREHLIGWSGAPDPDAAQELAYFACPACDAAIAEEQRLAMIRDVRLIHGDQRIDRAGRVYGDAPRTRRLWFHWTAFFNAFVPTSDLAFEEWEAEQLDDFDPDRLNAEKELCQFVWSRTWAPPERRQVALDRASLAKKTTELPRGVLPEDTLFWVIAADLGKWTSKCWWVALAFRSSGTLHVPAYGQIDVDGLDPRRDKLLRLRDGLDEWHRQVVAPGLVRFGDGKPVAPDAVWIDSNWETALVFELCQARAKEAGLEPEDAIYLPVVGRGASQMMKYRYHHPKATTSEVVLLGEAWHVRREHGFYRTWFDADFWKVYAQERAAVPRGEPGGLTLFAGTRKEHRRLISHLMSEELTTEWDPRKGEVEVWNKHGANHLLDCLAIACAAGSFLGFVVDQVVAAAGDPAGPAAAAPPAPPADEPGVIPGPLPGFVSGR